MAVRIVKALNRFMGGTSFDNFIKAGVRGQGSVFGKYFPDTRHPTSET
jgi:hypothetical protein